MSPLLISPRIKARPSTSPTSSLLAYFHHTPYSHTFQTHWTSPSSPMNIMPLLAPLSSPCCCLSCPNTSGPLANLYWTLITHQARHCTSVLRALLAGDQMEWCKSQVRNAVCTPGARETTSPISWHYGNSFGSHSVPTPTPLPESPFWSLLPGRGLSQLCLPLQGLLCSVDCVLNPSYLRYGYESRDFKTPNLLTKPLYF